MSEHAMNEVEKILPADRFLLGLFVFGSFSGIAGLALMLAPVFGIPSRAIFSSVWLMLYGLIFLRFRQLAELKIVHYLLASVVLLSAFLSQNAATAFTYGALYIGTIYSAVAIRKNIPLFELLNTSEAVLFASVALSLVGYALNLKGFRFFDPLERANWLGLEPFAGIFAHKIYAGLAAGCSAFASYYLKPKYWVAKCCLSLFALSLTQAVGAQVFFVATIAILLFFEIMNWRLVLSAVVLAALVVIAYFSIDSLGYDFSKFLGRDVTSLTGRLPIWLEVTRLWKENFWFGIGYETLAQRADFIMRFQSYQNTAYVPPNSHNTYLQYAVGTGLFGLLALMISLVSAFASLKTLSHSVNGKHWKLLFAWMVYFTLAALLESLFAHSTFSLFLLAFITAGWPAQNQVEQKPLGRITPKQ